MVDKEKRKGYLDAEIQRVCVECNKEFPRKFIDAYRGALKHFDPYYCFNKNVTDLEGVDFESYMKGEPEIALFDLDDFE